MARGTTQQILADLEHVRTHPSPVQVTRLPEAGMVQVTLSPSPEMQKAWMKKWAILAVMGIIMIGCGLGAVAAPPMILVLFLISAAMIAILTSYDRAARAYVFRMSSDAIVVASSGPLGPRHWECPREQVRDVRIWTRKKHLLIFDLAKPWRRRSHRRRMFTLDVPREKLIEVADAVREGLGMPRGQWD